jgi:hypothetical protein
MAVAPVLQTRGHVMAINRLSGDVKAFMVQRLACFDAPSTVAKAVREQFGETITRQGVECYDPYKRSGARLSRKWRQLFEETRKAFLAESIAIGISHRAVRLRKLEAQVELNEELGNSAMVAKLLEQAAKEMGGTYQSRREISGRAGSPTELRGPVDNRTRARAILNILAKAKMAREGREGG